MMYSVLALAGLASAAIPAGLQSPPTTGFTNPTVHVSKGGQAVCVSGNVSVFASTSKNLKLNYELPQNQSQVTETFVEFITQGSPFMQNIMGGMLNVSGTYNISSTLCMPPNAGSLNASSVQFLTHGVGFDKSYWDFAPGYSYADVAALAGHPTFFYDRLGVGDSSKPDPITTVQAPLEVEIAVNLISKLRNGTFANTNFAHVIGTGHSFGSIITEAITASHPKALDAAVLTGFSTNTSALSAVVSGLNLAIASENQPYRFASLNNGYLVSSSAISQQIGFFRAPGFDPKILNLAEATKGTVTVGELLTQGVVAAPALNFTGAVAVVDGNEDLPFCFGNCSYPANKAQMVLQALYPMASNVSTTYLAPITGHGVNLHYSAGEAFDFIQKFVADAGF